MGTHSELRVDENAKALASRRHPKVVPDGLHSPELGASFPTSHLSVNSIGLPVDSPPASCDDDPAAGEDQSKEQSKELQLERAQLTLRSLAFPLTAIATLMWILSLNSLASELFELSLPNVAAELMWRNASVRPPMLVVLVVGGWAWVVWTCRAASLNLEQVLGGPVQPVAATFYSAMVLFTILLAMHVTHLIASETPGLTWRPWLTCNLALHAAFVASALLPCNVLQSDSRSSLVRTIFESVVAPFGPVTFWHVIVADYLTSMAKALSDIQMTACISFHIYGEHKPGPIYEHTGHLWQSYHWHCQDTYSSAVVLALPFWWRLMQCLKVYYQTGEQKNLWNALKYSTAFPLVIAGYMRNKDPSSLSMKIFLIVSAVVQSTFTLVWDVLMDWGLPQRADELCITKGQWTFFGFALRDKLLISKKPCIYVILCVFNFFLRFAWTLGILGGVAGHGAGMFLFEFLEIGRRTVWAVFRIEWEAIVKQRRYLNVRSPEKPGQRHASNDHASAEELQPMC